MTDDPTRKVLDLDALNRHCGAAERQGVQRATVKVQDLRSLLNDARTLLSLRERVEAAEQIMSGHEAAARKDCECGICAMVRAYRARFGGKP